MESEVFLWTESEQHRFTKSTCGYKTCKQADFRLHVKKSVLLSLREFVSRHVEARHVDRQAVDVRYFYDHVHYHY